MTANPKNTWTQLKEQLAVRFSDVTDAQMAHSILRQITQNQGESIQSKMISNDQELIQSDPTSCPQNQKQDVLIFKSTIYTIFSKMCLLRIL